MATRFNINDRHVKYIRALLKNNDVVIIHGDGHMFASKNSDIVKYRDENGKIEDITRALKGSNHHKTFNAGFDDSEATSIAKYRAIYHNEDELSKKPEDIIEAFYRQASDNIREKMSVHNPTKANVFKVDEDTEEDNKASLAKAEAAKKAAKKAELKAQTDAEAKAEEEHKAVGEAELKAKEKEELKAKQAAEEQAKADAEAEEVAVKAEIEAEEKAKKEASEKGAKGSKGKK
jgi:hypothetical protein